MSVTLESRFPDIERDMRRLISSGVQDSAETVRDLAKAKVAVDDGDLKEVIHVERVGPAEWAVVAGGVSADGDNVWYGHLVERGHLIVSYERTEDNPHGRQRVASARTVHGHVAAKPFLIPALEAVRSEIEAKLAAMLKAEL